MTESSSQPKEWKESFLNSQCSIHVTAPGPITTRTPFSVTLSIDKRINIFFKPLHDGGYRPPALFLRRKCHDLSGDDRRGDTTQRADAFRLDIEDERRPRYTEPKEHVVQGVWKWWKARGQWTWQGLTFDRAGEWLVYFTFLEEEYWGALFGSQSQAYLTHMSITIVDE